MSGCLKLCPKGRISFNYSSCVVRYNQGRNIHDPFKDNQNDWDLFKELMGIREWVLKRTLNDILRNLDFLVNTVKIYCRKISVVLSQLVLYE